jgi:hypothetical protein
MLYYLTLNKGCLGVWMILDLVEMGERGPTLTEDQLESLRRSIYGTQSDSASHVDANGTSDRWE